MTHYDQREGSAAMFTLDGMSVQTHPVTWAHLYCGCFKFYDGHDIPVDRVAICPEPEVCDGHQNTLTAIRSVVRTELVG